MIYRVTDDVERALDSAEDWRERLGWVFGLIAEDCDERLAALRQQIAARRHAAEMRLRSNHLWHVTLPLGPLEQYREPAYARARELDFAARTRTLPDGFWTHPVGPNVHHWPGLPYALLFLEWEARYPQEWTAHAKAWGVKESLLKHLAVPGHSDAIVRKLSDLVMLAVQRAYRCKDREYVRVARAIDNAELRSRLAMTVNSDKVWARTHAEYLLWVLDRPGMPVTRRSTWTNWLAGSLKAPEARTWKPAEDRAPS